MPPLLPTATTQLSVPKSIPITGMIYINVSVLWVVGCCCLVDVVGYCCWVFSSGCWSLCANFFEWSSAKGIFAAPEYNIIGICLKNTLFSSSCCASQVHTGARVSHYFAPSIHRVHVRRVSDAQHRTQSFEDLVDQHMCDHLYFEHGHMRSGIFQPNN